MVTSLAKMHNIIICTVRSYKTTIYREYTVHILEVFHDVNRSDCILLYGIEHYIPRVVL